MIQEGDRMDEMQEVIGAIWIQMELFGLEALVKRLTGFSSAKAQELMREVNAGPYDVRHYMSEWPHKGLNYSIYLVKTHEGLSITVRSATEFVPVYEQMVCADGE
jgi:hypothetical protein